MTVQTEGGPQVRRATLFYNLSMILAADEEDLKTLESIEKQAKPD